MSPKPPDILRKSHRHTEGDERAIAKRELRQALADVTDESAEPQRYHGRCACGATGYVYTTRAEPSQWHIQRCSCDICTRSDALYAADAAGSVEFSDDAVKRVEHGTVGLGPAELLSCERCGDVIAAVTRDDNTLRAVVNLRLLETPPPLPDTEPIDHDDATSAARAQNEQRSWTPLR